MIDVFTAPERIKKPTTTTNPLSSSLRGERAGHLHGQAAEQIVLVFGHAERIVDHHHGQEANGSRQKQAVDEDDERRLFEVWQLGRFDLAVDLGQRLLAAHGENRMSEGDDQAEEPHHAEPMGAVPQRLGYRGEIAEEAERIFLPPGNRVHLGHQLLGVVQLEFFGQLGCHEGTGWRSP